MLYNNIQVAFFLKTDFNAAFVLESYSHVGFVSCRGDICLLKSYVQKEKCYFIFSAIIFCCNIFQKDHHYIESYHVCLCAYVCVYVLYAFNSDLLNLMLTYVETKHSKYAVILQY